MKTLIALVIALISSAAAANEDSCYRLITIPVPEHVRLEVTGLAMLPDNTLAAATRRGEIWILENVHDDPPTNVRYRLFASGLHEPLGLAHRDDALYVAQRSEVTRLRDRDGDGCADEYLTVAKGWGVTGNYHEYAYGPIFDRAGNLWITLNCTIGNKLLDDDAWRGWSLKIDPGSGEWEPISGGFRSPSGLGLGPHGEVFASEQQGNWFAAGAIIHIQRGAFHGHVAALDSCDLPGASFPRPTTIPTNLTVVQAAERISHYTLPAVWLPYRKMGMSATDILCDTTGGRFGPFADQLFVGEFTMSGINRVFMEKVNGVYQGACFPFRKPLQSAAVRLAWGRDGSLFIGQTNRGWNSLGTRSFGLQRLVWNGKAPFEIQKMEARRDGFLLTFTHPIKPESATPEAFAMRSFTYPYGPNYGGDEIDAKTLTVERIELSSANRSVRLFVDELRKGYVHALRVERLKAVNGQPLLHDEAFYTLNQIPKSRQRERGIDNGND